MDIGSTKDLPRIYGYSETVGGVQGYASIHRENQAILILKNYRTYQPINKSNTLFNPGTAVATARIVLGHIYLIRITDRHDPKFELVAKLLVIAYIPDQMITIRWSLL